MLSVLTQLPSDPLMSSKGISISPMPCNAHPPSSWRMVCTKFKRTLGITKNTSHTQILLLLQHCQAFCATSLRHLNCDLAHAAVTCKQNDVIQMHYHVIIHVICLSCLHPSPPCRPTLCGFTFRLCSIAMTAILKDWTEMWPFMPSCYLQQGLGFVP